MTKVEQGIDSNCDCCVCLTVRGQRLSFYPKTQMKSRRCPSQTICALPKQNNSKA